MRKVKDTIDLKDIQQSFQINEYESVQNQKQYPGQKMFKIPKKEEVKACYLTTNAKLNGQEPQELIEFEYF
jgi:hypothetical protein